MSGINKNFIIILFLTVVGPNVAFGQIKTSVTFTNPYVKEVKALNKTRKEYKKFLKDSLKRIKRINRYFDHKMDSLFNQMESEVAARNVQNQFEMDSLQKIAQDSTFFRRRIGSTDSYFKPQYSIDSTYIYRRRGLDSIEYTSMLSFQDSLGHFRKEALGMAETELLNLTGFGQVQATSASFVDSQEQLKGLRPSATDLELTGQTLAQQKSSFNRYKNAKSLKSDLSRISDSKLLQHSQQFNEVHKSLVRLKKRYLTLPSSMELSSGTKVGSLKDRPIKERLVLGGNIRITQGKGTNVDFSPSLAYLITKRFSTGVEAIYRGEFENGKGWRESFNTHTYGGRLFADYAVIRSFYAHTEAEIISTPTITRSDGAAHMMIPGAMLGIGRRFGVGGKVNGKVIIQYNFLHSENEIYSSAWVMRFGIEIKKREKAET